LIELEHSERLNETRAFYQKLNRSRKDFQYKMTLFRDKDSKISSSDEAILGR
jgi:hypothetical protein